MLSRVLAHISQDQANPAEYYSQALQLHGILSSFRLAIAQEARSGDPHHYVTYSSALGICYSALIALCDNHTCADLDPILGVGIPEQLKMQETALNGLFEIGISVGALAMGLGNLIQMGHIVSPFAAQCIYAAAVQYKWYIDETGKTEFGTSLNELKVGLRLIKHQWRVAGE